MFLLKRIINIGKCSVKWFGCFYGACQIILIWNNLIHFETVYLKSKNVNKMEQYYHEENIGYLVVKTLDKKYYDLIQNTQMNVQLQRKLFRMLIILLLMVGKLQGTF